MSDCMELFAERLERVEQMLGEVLSLLTKRSDRTLYQAKYYAERKGRRVGLKNLDMNNLDLPRGWDDRLSSRIVEWANTAYRFAENSKSPYKFLEWLSYTWNSATYWHRVITRSGGYNWIFIGFSGEKPLRCKWTDNDLFGCVNRTKFSRAQRDQFGNALWWRWGHGVLGKVVFEMQEDETRWGKLPKSFTKPLLLLMGGFGEVEVRQGLTFDPTEEDCDRVGRMYAYAKPDLDRSWDACKRGLYAKSEPFNGSTA